MIKSIVKDTFFLNQKSKPATEADRQVGFDLLDTLRAHQSECVGMAANMIGVRKNIIIFNDGVVPMVMFNPVITKKSDPYETEEGCLSLTGIRPTTRYRNIEVHYQDFKFQHHTKAFSGWTAQIIQHECDHLEGIII